MKENAAPVRALVLAGGGAKGSYHVGVYRALQQLGWVPDIITGASVGALNGVLFTMGKVQEAEDIWRTMELHDVLELPATTEKQELYNFFMDVVRSGGLNVEPLGETIDRYIDEDAARHSPIRFGLVMTELSTMRSIRCPIEDIPDGKLKDYMLASSACFPALRPREIDGACQKSVGVGQDGVCRAAAPPEQPQRVKVAKGNVARGALGVKVQRGT